MPLEMFDGKTGPRLIARLPVERGSFALITTDEVSDMAVYHPEHLRVNGYPAFSPFTGTLPTWVSAPIGKKREQLRRLYDEAYAVWRGEGAKLDNILLDEDDLRGGFVKGCAQVIADLHIAMLDHTRPLVDKQIICTTIQVGRGLNLRLPKCMFEQDAVADLGTVQSITIHNLGQAPVSVES